MSIEVKIDVETDSHNSSPGDVIISSVNGAICFMLDDGREFCLEAKSLKKALAAIEAYGE